MSADTYLSSLPQNFRAAVFGASGGIGGALAEALAADPRCGKLYAGARREISALPAAASAFEFDLEDETSIAAACAAITEEGPLHLVIVATGVLHAENLLPEKTWRDLDAKNLARAFAINAAGPALIGKHLASKLARQEKSVFAVVSARVGSISDNALGGWHAYRASKAALNMLMRNFAIELGRVNPSAIAVPLHPGTVDSGLSKPFQRGLRAGQLQGPEACAAALLQVIDRLNPADSGKFFAWDGAEIAF